MKHLYHRDYQSRDQHTRDYHSRPDHDAERLIDDLNERIKRLQAQLDKERRENDVLNRRWVQGRRKGVDEGGLKGRENG